MSKENPQEVWRELNRNIQEFAKEAAKLFQANNWTWGKETPPSEQEIAATLDSLSWEAYREVDKLGKEHSCVSTGRLQVRFNKYKSGWMGNMEVVATWKTV
jgi:hypothetical protein